MKTITNISAEFNILIPGIKDEYVTLITRLIDDLLSRYDAVELGKLYHSWSRDGNVFRSVRQYIAYDGDSMRRRQPTGVDTQRLDKSAQRYAEDTIAAFVAKLTKKLGDLTNVEIRDIHPGAFTFTITGTLPGGEALVRVEQSRIINVSPKGNPFHQWPALIYHNGQKVSEKKFKEIAANLGVAA